MDKVSLRDAEAIVRVLQDGQALGGLAADEEAARGAGAPPDAPAQLMQRRQAEALSALDHYHAGLRHINTNLQELHAVRI